MLKLSQGSILVQRHVPMANLKVPKYSLFYFPVDHTTSIIPHKNIPKVVQEELKSQGQHAEILRIKGTYLISCFNCYFILYFHCAHLHLWQMYRRPIIGYLFFFLSYFHRPFEVAVLPSQKDQLIETVFYVYFFSR